MAAYHEVIDDLRSFVVSISPIPVDRISWDFFGNTDNNQPPPDPINPGNSIWVRPILTGEVDVPGGGGWGWVEKTAVLTIECRQNVTADHDDSNLDQIASTIQESLRYAIVGDCEFESANVVPILEEGQPVSQINVNSVYKRLEQVTTTITHPVIPVNYTIPGHSFLVGNLVRPSGDASLYTLAQADSEDNAAYAIVSAVSGDRISLRFGGSLKITHGLGTSGDVYLSQTTAGDPTLTEYVIGVLQLVYKIIDAGEVLLLFDGPETLS